MLQSREKPYRTHQLKLSTMKKSSLPEGCYCGRVLDIEKHQDYSDIIILQEDHYCHFKTDQKIKFSAGEFISFSINKIGQILEIEQIATPQNTNLLPAGDALRWRKPRASMSRMNFLRYRHKMIRKIRSYFDAEEFIEVQTPTIVTAPSPESQFTPFRVGKDFLITSPEFQMKRLLVGGFEKIYQITSVFREGEIGPAHNPEFTMLEWYRAYNLLESMAEDLIRIIDHISEVSPQVENRQLKVGEYSVDLKPPWQTFSVRELFQRILNIDIKNITDAQSLKEAAINHGFGGDLDNVDDSSYEEVFFRLWFRIEPKLGFEKPVLVYDWPAPLASLAQLRCDCPNFAERMELYIAGMELANGFGELTDPKEQLSRFEEDMKLRYIKNQFEVPPDLKFIDSLKEGMPPSAGMALGIERLIMLFTGTEHIRDVMCFTNEER